MLGSLFYQSCRHSGQGSNCIKKGQLQKILILNTCNGAKQIYQKKKKKIQRKDTVQISEAVVGGIL